ncbi:MAG: SRPBCC domain-containing protein [Marinilabiliaceae bacterium]|nr:SRPBCC domain-containing protein [Marinilabiliaceae bacterium]
MSNNKVKIELEYIMQTSPSILFNRLSTPSGLSEWFADDVNLEGKIFKFIWDNSEQQAEMLMKKENKVVRFHWVDDSDEDTYFEFRIEIDELTGDTALVVIDFVDEEDKNDSMELWNQQIEILKHGLGSH